MILLILITVLLAAYFTSQLSKNENTAFDGDNAFKYAEKQLEFGARIPGSIAHQNTISYIESTLKESGWQTEIQEDALPQYNLKNIIAKRDSDTRPWVIIAAHYDTRFFADQDPVLAHRNQPVPGANDGASGVAILLELARVLPKDMQKNVWLVFFDAEDQGQISGWDWILGSKSFVAHLSGKPDQVVIIDMVGDTDLNLYFERNSDETIRTEIWNSAADLGYENAFIPQLKYSMLDDHTPFIEAGIPAIDIIDFDYPYWHTTNDTIDKISAQSMKMVGETLLNWLLQP